MYNTIKYLLLFATVIFVIVDCQITYGCYRQPDSPCSQHTLTCPDDQVIALDESTVDKIEYGRNIPDYTCPQDEVKICNATCCRRQGPNKDVTPVNQSYRLSVYRNCSNQPTCTVTPLYSPDTDYDYIAYPYICVPVNRVYNMMEIDAVSFPYRGYLYYSGRTQTTSSTRCCNITSTKPIEVEGVYIYLTEESSYNMKIYSENQTLLRPVDDGDIFVGFGELSISGNKMCHVVIDNLPLKEDDYVWLRIEAGAVLNITCDDCWSPSTASRDRSNNNGGGVNTGLTVGIIVVCLLLVVTWFIQGVYCIRRKMKRTQRSHESQNVARPVNASNTSTYADLVNNGPDTVINSGSEHHYTGLANINGSDIVSNSEPVHSAVPNQTEHCYTALSNPTRVQPEASTNVDYENTLTNTNEQRSKDNTYLSVIS